MQYEVTVRVELSLEHSELVMVVISVRKKTVTDISTVMLNVFAVSVAKLERK